MDISNNLKFSRAKFPISIPIAIILGLTHHILFVSNIEIQERKFIEKTNITTFDKKHLLIFTSPKKNSRILHFFPYEQWNSYFHSDRIGYEPLLIDKDVKIEKLSYTLPTTAGNLSYEISCEITKKGIAEYSASCHFNPDGSFSNSTYSYAYNYKFKNDLSIEVSNVHYSNSATMAKKSRDIQPDAWIGFLFYGLLTQYALIPFFIRLKRLTKRLIDKFRKKQNYDNFPPMRVGTREKK